MTARFSLVVAVALAAAACAETTYDFDGTLVGEDDGISEQAKSKTSSQFVRAIYADILGRAPERYDFAVSSGGTPAFTLPIDEEAFLVNTLDGMGDPAPLRALIVQGLVASAEVHLPAKADVADPAAFVRDQFRRLLGREPNTYELTAFVGQWQTDPAVGPRAVVRALAASREYQSK
jgi:hypothetical protein